MELDDFIVDGIRRGEGDGANASFFAPLVILFSILRRSAERVQGGGPGGVDIFPCEIDGEIDVSIVVFCQCWEAGEF